MERLTIKEFAPKIFYRVGTQNGCGMWYHPDGSFHGSMNSEAFNMLQCHSVTMPFDKDIVGYLSVADSLENLKNWFNEDDMKILEPLGFKILAYEATDYRLHQNHWVINQESSVCLALPIDGKEVETLTCGYCDSKFSKGTGGNYGEYGEVCINCYEGLS